MKLVFCFAILLAIFSYGETSSSDSSSKAYFYVDLDAFKTSYLSFLNNIVPIYSNTKKDVNTKLKEFSQMVGPQEFTSFPALISQYIPLYAICAQQIQGQLLHSAVKATGTPGSGDSILLEDSAFTAFSNGLKTIISGDNMVVTGIVQVITGIQKAVTSKSYNVTGTTLSFPQSFAKSMYDGFHGTEQGNKMLVKGIEQILAIQDSALTYQNNAAAKNFLTNYFASLQTEKTAYSGVMSESITFDNSFIHQNSATSTYTTTLSAMNQLIHDSGKAYAKLFGDAGDGYKLFRKQIIHSKSS